MTGGGGGGAGLTGARGGEAIAGAAARGAAAATGAGSGAAAPGFGSLVSLSPLRLPNTTCHSNDLLLPQPADQGREQAAPGLLGFAAAGEPLRDLQEHLGGAMACGDFRDHLAVVGGRTEQLRLEGDAGDRLALDRLGELGDIDLGALRHADLVQAIERRTVV